MQIILWFSLFLALFCLVYAGIIVLHVGVEATFLKFWIGSGIGAGIFVALLWYAIHQEIVIPKIVLLVLLVFIIDCALCELFLLIRLIRYGYKRPKKEPDVILVLGAKIQRHQITKSLRNRLDAVVTYVNQHHSKVPIIVSGGQGEDEIMTEAYAMKQYLLEQGVDELQIFLEEASTKTVENIKYSKELIEEMNLCDAGSRHGPIVYVATNRFHIYRAIKLCEKQGIHAEGLPSDADKVLTISYYVRESMAVVKDIIRGNMRA